VNDPAADPVERGLARAAYEALLPNVELSRCPYSGSAVSLPFDAVDLDGPYWDAFEPSRRDPDPGLPRSCIGLTGAMRLDRGRLAAAPFLALPGPARPFLFVDLIGLDDVTAVLSSVDIGPHHGCCVAYFTSTGEVPQALRPNLWGSRSFRYVYDDGRVVDGESELYDLDQDVDIEPWIADRKVAWIAAADPDLELRWGVGDCPYLTEAWSTGPADMQRVVAGAVDA
jgi:hypothetical protein